MPRNRPQYSIFRYSLFRYSLLMQILIGIAIAVPIIVLIPFILKWTGGGPKGLGFGPGGLNPCAQSPNCICSEDDREAFHAKRIELNQPADPQALSQSLLRLPYTQLIQVVQGPADDSQYGKIPEGKFLIHWEFRTPWIGYIDDVQIAGTLGERTVQIRSASRAGYSDLGVNRKRVEVIREHLRNQ